MVTKVIGIYRIISPTNNIYIGQTWDFVKRVKDYKKVACNKQIKLYNSFIKYGFSNHVIELLFQPNSPTQEILDEAEIFLINLYKSMGKSLNIRHGGSRGKVAEESKIKISESRKGKGVGNKYRLNKMPWNKGVKVSDETRKKISESRKGKGVGNQNKANTIPWNKGKPMSNDSKLKLSKSLSGRTPWNVGVKVSDETKKKISESLKGKESGKKGKKLSIETKKKISESLKNNKLKKI